MPESEPALPPKSDTNEVVAREAVAPKSKPKFGFGRIGFIFFGEFLLGCSTSEEIGEELVKVKKAWKALVLIAALLCGATAYWTHWYDESGFEIAQSGNDIQNKSDLKVVGAKIQFLNQEISDLKTAQEKEIARITHDYDIQTSDLKADRDKFQIQMTEAQDALAPWKELANSQFPGEPINKSLNQLLQKVDALQKAMQDSSTNPLQDPIASASATATIDVLTDKPYNVGSNIGEGGAIAFCSGDDAFLIAKTTNNETMETASGQGKYQIVGICSVDDMYMGKSVNSLLNAKYIQIIYPKSLIPVDTMILGGKVVWVINNRITLKFDIPMQAAKEYGANSGIIIQGISDGLQPLSVTPSH